MAGKKKLSANKAAEKIGILLHEGLADSPRETVEKHPELVKGLVVFERDDSKQPASRGSGTAELNRKR